jgi:2-hydroxychromene-2-carboxylate isomerase
MSSSDPIDFWFSVGSLYTFLAIMRMDRFEDTMGVEFRWRPFSVRTLMIEMDNIPARKPVKMEYAWRDVQRRAEKYGVPFAQRPPYPLENFDLANRIAVVGAQEGWCADYVRATYRRWFIEGHAAGAEPNVTDSLREIGQNRDRVLARAHSDEIGRAYAAATDEARALGLFGVPTFVARGELFWGDDRLEDAIAWQRAGTLVP